jgi:restriction endonuclease Mrr
MREYSSNLRQEIRIKLLEYVKENKNIVRSDLFEPAFEVFGLSDLDRRNKAADSNYGRAKSVSGIIINELIDMKLIKVDGNNIFYPEIPKNSSSKTIILNQIYDFFLTDEEKKDKTPDSKRGVLNCVIGEWSRDKELASFNISDIINEIQILLKKNKKFREALNSDKQNVSIFDDIFKEFDELYNDRLLYPLQDYMKKFHKLLTKFFGNGEEFFETFVFHLISKAYGSSVITKLNSAGPKDDGVDSEFVVRDTLGIQYKVIIQVKTKKNDSNLTVKVIREYLGVMLLQKADYCIIISNTQYTKSAIDEAAKSTRVMLIDNKQLYELMRQLSYGITIDKDLYPALNKQDYINLI